LFIHNKSNNHDIIWLYFEIENKKVFLCFLYCKTAIPLHKDKIKSFYNELSKGISNIKSCAYCICGDFNARLGKITGDLTNCIPQKTPTLTCFQALLINLT